MKSCSVATYHVDDIDLAVSELVSGIKNKIQLEKNSIGLLFCESEMEHKQFLKKLKENLDIEIIGCTGVATLETHEGHMDTAISLMVMTGDDVEFSLQVSEAYNYSNFTEKIGEAYNSCVNNLKTQPKLIVLYSTLQYDIAPDYYAEELSRISGSLPVFGGVAGFSEVGSSGGVIYNDNIYTDRSAILVIGGNVNPVFSIGSLLTNSTKDKKIVTKSKGNIVYNVDDMTFYDYLISLGLDKDRMFSMDSVYYFVASPIILEYVDEYGEQNRVLRVITAINPEDGSGISTGAIKEGCQINIGNLSKNDIEQSTLESLNNALAEIKNKGQHKYSTCLISTCLSRYLVMTGATDIEGDVLKLKMPPHISYAGFYGCGEFCPSVKNEGRYENITHNETITFCFI